MRKYKIYINNVNVYILYTKYSDHIKYSEHCAYVAMYFCSIFFFVFRGLHPLSYKNYRTNLSDIVRIRQKYSG